MATTAIRSLTPALWVPGTYTTPSDRIGANEGGQLMLRLDIPLPDFADASKRVEYSIEYNTGGNVWQKVAGAGWKGSPTYSYKDPVRGFVVEPSDPTNPLHWSWLAVDLDGTHVWLRGARIRAVFHVLDNSITAGVIYERRTGTDKF